MRQIGLIVSMIFLLTTGCSQTFTPSTYQYGDCITPTDKNASWYGEYAKVEAFVKSQWVESFKGNAYVLWFPKYNSLTHVFDKSWIESSTMKVDYLKNCGIPNQKLF